jgi:hypothetical protein
LNEQLKQLAEQAGFVIACQRGVNEGKFRIVPGWDGICIEEVEKFAELIVSKCIELMDENYRGDMYTGDVYASEYNNCINEQVEALEDYFGVNK